jgi:hypothetical protein
MFSPRISSAFFLLFLAAPLHAADLKILLPLQRKVYQTNERIDLSVVRYAKEALPAGDLVLTLAGEDGSRLSFTFPVSKAEGGRAVEHLHLNGRLLRPGKYKVEVAGDGATAKTDIEIYSHIRKSSFRLINWVQGKGKAHLPMGEDNLGYNLYYGQGPTDEQGDLIRAGVDFMSNCTMSGGHQMDLRMECDWSDPYVIRGGTRRVVKRAMIDRTRPNVLGVHFYDEPGLTWHKDPKTGENTPQGIPSQMVSFEAAFGYPLKDYFKIDPKNGTDATLWDRWARWKLGFMDAAWKDSQFGVRYVRPDFLSVTQSQYGWTAFTDGYYFNVVRSLPVISGHGGYHDFGPGYFNPSFFLEMARARDYSRPNWYLPTWYGNTTSDQFRLEQYLSFQTNIQGMMSPPDLDPGIPEKSKAAAGIVESNHLMSRLGTIFTTMPVTKPPVAVLYSLSNSIHKQTSDMSYSYAHASPHGRNLMFTYLAGKLMQHQFLTVVEEDVVDGTLAAEHKAIILTSLDYLAPKVVAALEDFAKQKGLVILTKDCKVKIKGGVIVDVAPGFPEAAKVAELEKAGKWKEAEPFTRMRQALAGARELALELQPLLRQAGIKPIFKCVFSDADNPLIVATRQAAGDIEYIFAVNATHDEKGDPMLGMKSVRVCLQFEKDPRPFYDAIHGGLLPDFAANRQIVETLQFGPGQMRVWARTARPIGGIQTSTPIVRRDFGRTEAPLTVDIRAALLDKKGRLMSGSAPLRIRLMDPLGNIRYDLYRATDGGILKLNLPLACNDPSGEWKVQVIDLLANTQDMAGFTLKSASTCSAAAGATRRAVHLEQDKDNIFRFFRTHRKVTIIKGSAPYHQAAAERLVKILKPWNVECAMMSMAEANKPRSLSEEEAKTWSGMDYSGKGQIKAGDKNPPFLVGFAVQGPVILLGAPEDNALTKFLQDQKFLPYLSSKDEFPGPGRGLVAWQREGIGVLQESITLIAYDEKGMAEAVGNMFEMLAGMEPLTPLVLPAGSSVTAAKTTQRVPELKLAGQMVLPDRIIGISAKQGKATALTAARVRAQIDGKIVSEDVVNEADFQKLADELRTKENPQAQMPLQKKAAPGRLVKFALPNGKVTAVAYWGGAVALVNADGVVQAERRLPQDITAMAWSGENLLVGDADGRLTVLSAQ